VLAVAAAEIRTGEAAGKVAEITHQVHGAIGFTYEYSLHRLSRRLWSWRDEFGTESHWSRELDRHHRRRRQRHPLVAAGGELGPELINPAETAR
jgi:alkylation response protein AidB-like acyl-CoA dehydrogenase